MTFRKGLLSFISVFYIAWSGVITLNEINQRQQVLTEINSQIDTVTYKTASLVNLAIDIDQKDKTLHENRLEILKPDLITLKEDLATLEGLRSKVIALIIGGTQTKNILLRLKYAVYISSSELNEIDKSISKPMNIINKMLPTKIIWHTSTGSLVSMLTVIAAITGALVQSIRDSINKNERTQALFRTLSAGVGAGVICFLVVNGGASILFPDEMTTTNNPHFCALVGFIAGMYSDSFYEAVYTRAAKLANTGDN